MIMTENVNFIQSGFLSYYYFYTSHFRVSQSRILKLLRATSWITAAVIKWKLFPATDAARRLSASGKTGTPIAEAVSPLMGKPSAAKRSFGHIHVSVWGWYILPPPVLKVGMRPLTADHVRRFRALSPKNRKTSGSSCIRFPGKRSLYFSEATLTQSSSRRFRRYFME